MKVRDAARSRPYELGALLALLCSAGCSDGAAGDLTPVVDMARAPVDLASGAAPDLATSGGAVTDMARPPSADFAAPGDLALDFPSLTLTQKPADPSNAATPTFAFQADDSGVTFECRIDGAAPFAACTSPYTAPALADGPQTFRLRATSTRALQTTIAYGWTVDTVAPTVQITSGPSGTIDDATPTFTFSASADAVSVECDVDGTGFAACVSPYTSAPLADGAHTFTVRARDAATNAASASSSFTVAAAPPVCGDGSKNGGEVCDGADLGGASCASLGFPPGTLGCAASCDAYDTSRCNGGFAAAGSGFTGPICWDGLKHSLQSPGQAILACSESAGLFRAVPSGATVWSDVNGTTAPTNIDDLHGRFFMAPADSPAAVLLTDNSGAHNAFRSNAFATGTPPAWTQLTFSNANGAFELFAAIASNSTNNLMAGWHPQLGAVVLHGNFAATASASAIGAGIDGTVRSLARNGVNDVYAAVYGLRPDGSSGSGGGVYFACDIAGTAGGTFVERDSGWDAADKPLVWSLTVDPSSTSADTRLCAQSSANLAGWARVYYAAVRGGGAIYKTSDGGASWSKSGTGLPSGVEVYKVALDCGVAPAGGATCVDPTLLYAATSRGLYQSTNAGASWTLAGFKDQVVRAVALAPSHAVGTPPSLFVGVDDATGIYNRDVP